MLKKYITDQQKYCPDSSEKLCSLWSPGKIFLNAHHILNFYMLSWDGSGNSEI